LQAAIRPHLESFNALLEENGLLEHAIRDIGTKVFHDGNPGDEVRHRLSVRFRELFIDKAQIPATNKYSTRNREIFPAECRERNATYRGRMRAKLEFRVDDGPWHESVRDLGQVPIMLKLSLAHAAGAALSVVVSVPLG
jgi:DNA-directed RNA polymerase I subunit RPA2